MHAMRAYVFSLVCALFSSETYAKNSVAIFVELTTGGYVTLWCFHTCSLGKQKVLFVSCSMTDRRKHRQVFCMYMDVSLENEEQTSEKNAGL